MKKLLWGLFVFKSFTAIEASEMVQNCSAFAYEASSDEWNDSWGSGGSMSASEFYSIYYEWESLCESAQ